MKTFKKFKWVPKEKIEPLGKEYIFWGSPAYKKEIINLELEYRECRTIESGFAKKLSKFNDPENIRKAELICRQICEKLYISRNPHVYHFPNVCGPVLGYCSGKNIVIQTRKICLKTLLHELAHYIVYREKLKGTHHDDFLWVLEMVYQTFFNLERNS